YTPTIDHNVYRRICTHEIPVQTASADEFAVSALTDRIVERRKRQHFDPIDDAGDAAQPGHAMFSVRFGCRPHYLSIECYRAAIDLKSQIIKDAIVRQHHELFANFFDKLLTGYRP